MSNDEALFAIGICLAVFIVPILGIVIYAVVELRRQQKELREHSFKTQVLIESMIEIFETKYKLYEDDDKGGISPGG